jgi:hypothetical protein
MHVFGWAGCRDGESIISHWNMAEFLPTKLQDHFIIAISSFILSIHKNRLLHYKLQKARKTRTLFFTHFLKRHAPCSLFVSTVGDASEANNGKRANVLDQRVYSEEDEEASEVKELKEIIPLRFMQKLFTLVQDIQKITIEISDDQKRRRGRYCENHSIFFIQLGCSPLTCMLDPDTNRSPSPRPSTGTLPWNSSSSSLMRCSSTKPCDRRYGFLTSPVTPKCRL